MHNNSQETLLKQISIELVLIKISLRYIDLYKHVFSCKNIVYRKIQLLYIVNSVS